MPGDLVLRWELLRRHTDSSRPGDTAVVVPLASAAGRTGRFSAEMQHEIERLAYLELFDCGRPVPVPGDTARDLACRILVRSLDVGLTPYQVVPSVSSSLTLWYYDGTVHAEAECYRDGRVVLAVDHIGEGDETEVEEYDHPTDAEIAQMLDRVADHMDLASLRAEPLPTGTRG